MIYPSFVFHDEFNNYLNNILEIDNQIKKYPSGSIISEAHDKSASSLKIFFVKRGLLKVSTTNEDGSEGIMFYLKPGTIYPINLFQNQQFLDDFLYMTAITESELIAFSQTQLAELIQNNSGFAQAAINYYANYASLFLLRSMILSYNNALLAISTVLYMLYKDVSQDDRIINVKQEDIGKLLNLSRVHVSRALQVLQKAGIIQLHRGRIQVMDPEALSKYCPQNYQTTRDARRM